MIKLPNHRIECRPEVSLRRIEHADNHRDQWMAPEILNIGVDLFMILGSQAIVTVYPSAIRIKLQEACRHAQDRMEMPKIEADCKPLQLIRQESESFYEDILQSRRLIEAHKAARQGRRRSERRYPRSPLLLQPDEAGRSAAAQRFSKNIAVRPFASRQYPSRGASPDAATKREGRHSNLLGCPRENR